MSKKSKRNTNSQINDVKEEVQTRLSTDQEVTRIIQLENIARAEIIANNDRYFPLLLRSIDVELNIIRQRQQRLLQQEFETITNPTLVRQRAEAAAEAEDEARADRRAERVSRRELARVRMVQRGTDRELANELVFDSEPDTDINDTISNASAQTEFIDFMSEDDCIN